MRRPTKHGLLKACVECAKIKVPCSLVKKPSPQQPGKSTFMVIDTEAEDDPASKKRGATDVEGGSKKRVKSEHEKGMDLSREKQAWIMEHTEEIAKKAVKYL